MGPWHWGSYSPSIKLSSDAVHLCNEGLMNIFIWAHTTSSTAREGPGWTAELQALPQDIDRAFQEGQKEHQEGEAGAGMTHDVLGSAVLLLILLFQWVLNPQHLCWVSSFFFFLFFISCVSNFGCTIKVSLLLQPVMVQQEMKDSRKQEVAEAKWMHDFWCQGHDQDILCHVHKEIGLRFAEADIQMYAHCSVPKHSSADMATCETAWAVIHCKYR